MSSLRISHQNRGVNTLSAGGDAGRSDASSADAASFAAALGVAGLGSADASTTLLGGTAGGSSDDSGGSRKRGDGQLKLDDISPSLVAQGSLTTISDSPFPRKRSGDHGQDAETVAQAIASQGSIGGQSLPATTAPDSLTATDQGAAQGSATTSDLGSAAAASAGACALASSTATGQALPSLTASDMSSAVTIDTPGTLAAADSSGRAARTISGPIDAYPPSNASSTQSATASQSVTTPEVASAASDIATGVARTVATPSAHRAPPSSADPTTTAAPAPPPAGGEVSAQMADQTPQSNGLPAGWTPVDPSAAAVTTDAGGTLPAPGPVSTTGPNPGALRAIPAAAAPQLAQILPAAAAVQASAGDSGVTAVDGTERGRVTPLAAASDTGDTGAAAALTDSGTAPAATLDGASASSAAPTATATAAISDQVAGHLVRMVSNGSRDMVVRLRPPELGELTVRVAINGRDVSAWFASPQPQVQSAITAAIGQLQTSLGDAGYNLNGAWVGADSAGAGQQNSSQPAPLPSVAQSMALTVGLAPAVASPSAASGLNIYV